MSTYVAILPRCHVSHLLPDKEVLQNVKVTFHVCAMCKSMNLHILCRYSRLLSDVLSRQQKYLLLPSPRPCSLITRWPRPALVLDLHGLRPTGRATDTPAKTNNRARLP